MFWLGGRGGWGSAFFPSPCSFKAFLCSFAMPEHKYFVGGLHPDVDREEMFEIFEPYGKVLHAGDTGRKWPGAKATRHK